MKRIRLVHWNAKEANERAKRLRDLGYRVDRSIPSGAAFLEDLRARPPAAVVIDLSRLPARGRDLALMMRESDSTRFVPILFLEGPSEKVARIQKLLPDASYSSWRGVRGALKRAIAHPPKTPLVHNRMSAYAATPLAKKLGVRPEGVVALVGAPEGFEKTLGELPAGAVVRRNVRGRRQLTLWFATSRKELEARIARMRTFAGNGGLWMIWPKKTSGLPSDLTQAVVRRVGEGAGLVDFKIAAIDETWSGLRFTLRE